MSKLDGVDKVMAVMTVALWIAFFVIIIYQILVELIEHL